MEKGFGRGGKSVEVTTAIRRTIASLGFAYTFSASAVKSFPSKYNYWSHFSGWTKC